MGMESLQNFKQIDIPEYPHEWIYHYSFGELELEIASNVSTNEIEQIKLIKGMSACLKLNPRVALCDWFDEGFFVWVEIIANHSDLLVGKMPELGLNYKLDFNIVEFQKQHIFRIDGPLRWKLDAQYVYASKKVINGESVGYFYYSFDPETFHHFPLNFYSISELGLVKSQIPLFKVKLRDIIFNNPELVNYMKCSKEYGLIRMTEHSFKVLDEHDHVYLDREIFPRSVEIDSDE